MHAEEAPDEKLKINKLGPNVYIQERKKFLQMKRGIGMACQKYTNNARKGGYKSKAKYTHPYRHVFHKRVGFLVYLRSSFLLSIACIARPSYFYTASLSIL